MFAACSPQCCSGRGRRPGRGKNAGLMILACHRLVLPPSRAGYKGRGSLRPEASRGAEGCFRPAALCQRWLRDCLDVRCWWCANVFTCFSVGGTGLNGVTVRLFFDAGCIVGPRVVLIVCFSPGGSGWSFCPAALSLLRGFDVAWSSLLEARTCLLSLSLLCVPLGRVLASVSFVWSWGLPPSWAGYKYGAHHAGISAMFIVLVCWWLPPSRAGRNTGLSQLAIFDIYLSGFAGDCRRFFGALHQLELPG